MVVILKIRLSPLFAAGQIWWSGTMLSGFFSFNPQIIDIVGLMIIICIFGALIVCTSPNYWGKDRTMASPPQKTTWFILNFLPQPIMLVPHGIFTKILCRIQNSELKFLLQNFSDTGRWSKKTQSDKMKNPLLSFVPCVNLCRSHFYCMYCLYCIFV